METTDFLIKEIQKGIINWYDFNTQKSVLYIGNDSAISEYLSEVFNNNFYSISAVELTDDYSQKNAGKYYYIVSIAEFEKTFLPEPFFEICSKLLDSNGHMLIGANNRLGMRYFCGDRDPYTDHVFDSLDNYKNAYTNNNDTFMGKMYDKSELTCILKKSGWKNYKFFSVLSDLNNPTMIISETYTPNEDLANRVLPTYNHPDSIFLEEESLYESFIRNGVFHEMTNAFIIDCTMNAEPCGIQCVTSSMERGHENAMLTIIRDEKIVEKKAVYPEGAARLQRITENLEEIASHGIKVVDTKLKNDTLYMPFMDAEVGQRYLKRLIYSDKNAFLSELDRFRNMILSSSEIISEDKHDGEGTVLRKAYLDLVPLNSFYVDGEFMVYDQEFCVENYPANVLIWRMIASLYAGNEDFNKIIPFNDLVERYDLAANRRKWQKMENDFLSDLRNTKSLKVYREGCYKNREIINSNRQRINYSDAEYQRLFVNIFIGNKKIILFGSGNFTKRFIAMYGKEYPIYAIIDNNSEKWGQKIHGIEIVSPDILKEISEDDYKIIVCIKKFNTVANQLDKLGFKNYSIFDTARSYPKQFATVVSDSEKSTEKKKYHIGYVAGVFDMYHVGHLNMFRKAKEQCDYLIVGVVPDEGVFRQKNKYPIIPCEDRVEIVQSCRYVDKAEALPLECRSIRDAYKMYKFDCMFTGTDYANNPDWLTDKEYLKKNGADIMFFPYTEKVSSSMLREKIK